MESLDDAEPQVVSGGRRYLPVPQLFRRALIVALLASALVTTAPVQEPVTVHAAPGWTTPTVPPRCTTEQANSGNVAGCVLYGSYGRPEANGWPTPPFPTTTPGQSFPPTGWNWNGYTYNGSPALAEWEGQFLSNTTPIGAIRAGVLESLPEALVLFEGFMREAEANGYRFSSLGGYTFRCTSSSTRNCAGLTVGSLSHHAYGLAIDFNAGTNPIRTYYGINGATACATPMVTDIPQWMVQIAEKWGLYWGGYGWSSGCSSPGHQRTSVSRDPPHFEFRGTVEQARAIAAFNGATPTGHCLDVENSAGSRSQRCYRTGEVPAGGTRMVIDTGAPAGTQSVLVNIVATQAAAVGYLTAEPCGPAPAGIRPWSNVNIRPGATVANLAVVPVNAAGEFCLYQSALGHSIVDVQGFFRSAADAPGGSEYVPIEADRLLDTRDQSFCRPGGGCVERGPVPSNSEVELSVVAPNATAVLANLTVTETAWGGYLTADDCESLVPGPQQTSNVNYAAGATTGNLAVVPTTGNGQSSAFCVYTTAATQIVGDAVGYFAPSDPNGLGYQPADAARLLDTRECYLEPGTASSRCGQPVTSGTVIRVQGPAGADAAMINLIMVGAIGPNYATAGPCSQIVPGPQQTSNLNATSATPVSNLSVVALDDDGMFCVYVSGTAHVVADLQGWFSNDAPLRLTGAEPTRRHDSRGPTG